MATIIVIQGKHFILCYPWSGPINEAGIMFALSIVLYDR